MFVLVCGNMMVFKLFEIMLFCVLKVVEILIEVGVFKGVYNVV